MVHGSSVSQVRAETSSRQGITWPVVTRFACAHTVHYCRVIVRHRLALILQTNHEPGSTGHVPRRTLLYPDLGVPSRH